jgi:hypothetical protein
MRFSLRQTTAHRRRRQPPHCELDPAIGKLSPVFDNRHVSAGWEFAKNFARL